MKHAIGISVHTGWGACVVVAGSLAKPEIVARQRIEMLGDSERFCFHLASEMPRVAARRWITRARAKALANAKRGLAPLFTEHVRVGALVAKPGEVGELEQVLASHPRIHTAEGSFYRDVLLAACPVRMQLVPPSSLDASRVGKLAAPPWAKDHKLAALAAWRALEMGITQ